MQSEQLIAGEEVAQQGQGCQLAWYAVRTRPKHERLAAASLRQFEELEVFSPRVRVRRRRMGGAMWMTESLFPNYLFARFDAMLQLDRVRFIQGIQTVVHFGPQVHPIPDEVVEELRSEFGDDEIRVIDTCPTEGQEVVIQTGPFRGYSAVVVQAMPAQQRVRVLLEFMQRLVYVHVDSHQVIAERPF
jgi:transcriptional antiterminator RfaH